MAAGAYLRANAMFWALTHSVKGGKGQPEDWPITDEIKADVFQNPRYIAQP